MLRGLTRRSKLTRSTLDPSPVSICGPTHLLTVYPLTVCGLILGVPAACDAASGSTAALRPHRPNSGLVALQGKQHRARDSGRPRFGGSRREYSLTSGACGGPSPPPRRNIIRTRAMSSLGEALLSFALEQRRGDLLGGQHWPALRLLAEVFRPLADPCVSRLERDRRCCTKEVWDASRGHWTG